MRRRYGPWRFRQGDLTLVIGPGDGVGYEYDVDLERMTNSAEVLDWICQIATKSWGTPRVLGHLVAAIDDLLAPQRTLCSWGEERGPIDVAQTLREIHDERIEEARIADEITVVLRK